MDIIQERLLKEVADLEGTPRGAFNIRVDGSSVDRRSTPNIEITSKKDKPGIDIRVKAGTKGESIHIPVMLTKMGLVDLVYNDFYIGEDADVVIIAGCGIHNSSCETSQHDGIHSFYLEKNAKVKYIEKHYGEGEGTGKRILNPITNIHLSDSAALEMQSLQIKGVDSTIRETSAYLAENSNLVISEKVFTHGKQTAKTIFNVDLNGVHCSANVSSRSIASDDSAQEFVSNVNGNTDCFAHIECDAIIMDHGKVTAIPSISANNVDSRLIHEASIGKIAGDQLIKLMTLGLTEKEAEEQIINGFLK